MQNFASSQYLQHNHFFLEWHKEYNLIGNYVLIIAIGIAFENIIKTKPKLKLDDLVSWQTSAVNNSQLLYTHRCSP